MAMAVVRFWEHKTLFEMTPDEWESLCDGCGKCCLNKLEDEDTGEVFYTCVACIQLDTVKGGCKNYSDRLQLVPGCMSLKPENVAQIQWLPSTCAYRLLSEAKPLPAWHPLVSGDANSVHAANASVLGKVYREDQVAEEDLEEYIVHWVD